MPRARKQPTESWPGLGEEKVLSALPIKRRAGTARATSATGRTGEPREGEGRYHIPEHAKWRGSRQTDRVCGPARRKVLRQIAEPARLDAASPFHKRTTTRQGSSSPAHTPLKMAPKTAKKSTFVVDCSKPGASRVRTAIPARSRRRGVFLGFLRRRASARRPETRDVPRRGSRDALSRGRATSLGACVSGSTPVTPSRPPPARARGAEGPSRGPTPSGAESNQPYFLRRAPAAARSRSSTDPPLPRPPPLLPSPHRSRGQDHGDRVVHHVPRGAHQGGG